MPLTVKRHKKGKASKYRSKKKMKKQRSKQPKIKMKHISEIWDNQKSAKRNLSEMGLSYDPNKSVGRAVKSLKLSKNNSFKIRTAEALETEAKAPRVIKFKFPNAQAIYFSYLIKKYGDNYKEMVKDPKNVYQETWKQIRSKIVQFKKLEQYRKVMGGIR